MASSPTPRDELDEKLNEALIGLYTRNAEGEFIPVNDKADVLKDEIKQAFKDAGYHKECPPKVTDGTLYPLLWAKSNGYMTGQYWYDKFKALVDEMNMEPEIVNGAYLDAAEKAAGIQD